MKKKLLLFSLILLASASTNCYWGRGYGGYGLGLGWGLGAATLAYGPYYAPYYNPYYYRPYPYYAPPAPRSIHPAVTENIKDQGRLEALKTENNRKERALETKRSQSLNTERKNLDAQHREKRKIERKQELDNYNK